MKGILLAGGDGTRLRPLTHSVNKHLLRIGMCPMIEYPLMAMITAGIEDIHVVTGGENYQGVVKYLGSGSKWGARISYSIQDRPGGIAQALSLAEPFVGNDDMLVILGDNVFDMELKECIEIFKKKEGSPFNGIKSAMIKTALFSCYSDTPQRFGVLKFETAGANDYPYAEGSMMPVDVIEKPKDPPSNAIVTGIYMYRSDVFDVIRTLKPSDRGELEITDVNRRYIKAKQALIVTMDGEWTDCGTFETLMAAEEQVKTTKKSVQNTV